MLVDFPTFQGFFKSDHVMTITSRDRLETIDYINNIEHNECFITSHKIQIKITWLKLP